MTSSRKTSRSSRIHNLSAARKKKINLPVHVTRVQENEDPLELSNPFTIHPLPEFNENREPSSAFSEESTKEKFSFETVKNTDFLPAPNEELLPETTSILSNSPSVLNLPSSQSDELKPDSFNQEQAISEQTSLPDTAQLNPKDLIKVNFGTFVELIVSQDVEKILEQHAQQELIMSTNLLTRLASLRDNREEKKIPLVFLVGIAIGVVLTYIFFSSAG